VYIRNAKELQRIQKSGLRLLQVKKLVIKARPELYKSFSMTEQSTNPPYLVSAIL